MLVASGVFANSYSSAVAYTSGVISLDGGDTESFYFRSNSSISVRLIESHKIKVTWTYSYPLTNVHALILYK